MKKAIFFKTWMGEWERAQKPATKKNLAWVKKHWALNGQAMIQEVQK